MIIRAYKIRPLFAPKDSLKDALSAARISIQEGDIVAISSKVVSIDEGNTLLLEAENDKGALVQKEADWYLRAPKSSKYRQFFTITKGTMAGSAGIDESNGSGHYIFYPKDPFKSARKIRAWLMKEYKIKTLGVIITDSTSIPLRRGAIGFALSWDGFDPLRDYRGHLDIFGRSIRTEMADLVDGLAAAAVFEMGEGNECTPIAVIRNARNIVFKNRSKTNPAQLIVSPEDDIFAPLFFNKIFKWKKNR